MELISMATVSGLFFVFLTGLSPRDVFREMVDIRLFALFVVILAISYEVLASDLPCPTPPAPGRNGPYCPEGWVRQSNKCYSFSNEWKTQDQARLACEWNGGTLAAIHSSAENDYVLQNIVDDAWIGLIKGTNSTDYQWVDGSPLEVTFWSDGEPGIDTEENCVELIHWAENPDVHGRWNNIACGALKTYACAIDLEYECKKYPSCEWSDSQERCNLKDLGETTGYILNSPVENFSNGIRVNLTRAEQTGMYGETVEELIFTTYFLTGYHLQFKIEDKNNQRYEVPVPLNIVADENLDPEAALYKLELLNDTVGSPFAFRVVRLATGRVIFDTSVSPLIFDEQFLQISTTLTPECSLYGFGENPHTRFRHDFSEDKVFPMFARDEFPNDGEKNNYGVHPYYQCMEDAEGNTHSVLLFNSNAMEYGLFKTGQIPVVTLRSIGGILDFHMFLGPEPKQVTKQYLEMLGRPFLPPYWSLGFQISRYGYKSVDQVKEVVDRTRAAGIPQDVQYADIDYMDEFKDFTYDLVNWADLPNYVRDIKTEGLRFVVILDPAIVIDFTDNYPAGKRADEADVFIKWPNQLMIPDDQPENAKDYMVGYVWPLDRTAFPDFWKNSTQEWWINEIQLLHDTIPFDGLWIDMNEPANFGTNLVQPWNWPEGKEPWSLKCTDTKWDIPPYKTKACNAGDNQSGQLTDKTICMVGTHHDDTTDPSNPVTRMEYDVHSLFGWRQAEPSLIGARKATGTRSMVFSRSTFPTSGKTVGHWYGDNTSRWVDLYRSIIHMFEFEMFGIPYGGADICGFAGSSWEELCLRWMQLGSFYPFSRNHNSIDDPDQDPAVWESVAEASRISLGVRYTLLPYLYTLFFHSHTKGETVARPFTYEFPSDLTARDIDTQFMWGSHLVFSPILTEEPYNTRSAYFPQGRWYNYFTKELEFEGPVEVQLEVPDMAIPIHLRGGGIVVTQQPALNTMASRKNPFGILVALDENGTASGDFFWDDGESLETVENGEFHFGVYSFNAEDGLTYTVEKEGPAAVLEGLNLEEIVIMGWKGGEAPNVQTSSGTVSSVDLNLDTKVLTIGVTIPLKTSFNLSLS